MPVVQIDMLVGRSTEQKRALVKKVTEAICETANCPADAVTIVLREMPQEHLAKGGILRLDS